MTKEKKIECSTCKHVDGNKCNHPQGCECEYELWEEKKENRGGKREGAGAKGKYICELAKLNTTVPIDFLEEVKAFIIEGRKKYLIKK